MLQRKAGHSKHMSDSTQGALREGHPSIQRKQRNGISLCERGDQCVCEEVAETLLVVALTERSSSQTSELNRKVNEVCLRQH